ncbi:hypothethical protein (plasmid) [Ralstonia solanacearum CMR15]|nr:hypothethical protein [Ralstonia solanacearum CMR15]
MTCKTWVDIVRRLATFTVASGIGQANCEIKVIAKHPESTSG